VRSIPVLMFHGVAPDRPDRPPQMDHWLEPGTLDRYLRQLRRSRTETLFLGELREIREGKRRPPRRAAVLTFDDGYLDFWLYIFPLLQEHRVKATVFVTTDFIDPAGEPRSLPEAFPFGFLSWPEMCALEGSGLVEVQSHARTHTWYPIGPKLLDVHRPDLPWKLLRGLWWNRFPERKPGWYREGRHDDLPWGLPVLENEKALLARRYHLRPEIEEAMVAQVAARGGAEFFGDPSWRSACESAWREACAPYEESGTWESEEERRARVAGEIRESREILSAGLGREVRYLCCPGGSLNAEVVALARENGYDGISIPRWFQDGRNAPGGDPFHFYRVPTTSVFRRLRSPATDALAFTCRVNHELGIFPYTAGWRALRALRRLGAI